MKNNKKDRQGTVKKGQKPTDSLTLISTGSLENKILKYLSKLNNERFNIHAVMKLFGVQRSTIYSALKTLQTKGLVDKPHYGQHVITDSGRHFLEASGNNRTVSRGGGEPVGVVRDHKFTFKCYIYGKPGGWGDSVGILDRHGIQTKLHNFSKNNPLLHTTFPGDVDVAFTTSHVLIKPKNIYENDHSSASFKAIAKAQEVLLFLNDLGFNLKNDNGVLPLIQTEGHYAEVNSLLAQFFEKTARGFAVKGSDGDVLFWIDHSHGHLEDETASETARVRLERQMRSIMENDLPSIAELSEDLKDLKLITADLVKIQLMGLRDFKDNDNHDNFRRPDYFG